MFQTFYLKYVVKISVFVEYNDTPPFMTIVNIHELIIVLNTSFFWIIKGMRRLAYLFLIAKVIIKSIDLLILILFDRHNVRDFDNVFRHKKFLYK